MELSSFKGVVKNIKYNSDDFYIFDVFSPKHKSVVCKTNRDQLWIGLDGEFYGNWVVHPKYGKQFTCDYIIEKVPETSESFMDYIKSKKFKGIGDVAAKKISDFLGENPVNKLNENVDIILEVPDVNKEVLGNFKSVWIQNQKRNEISVKLRGFGLKSGNIEKIFKSIGYDCIKIIETNPYILIYKVKGIGFKAADGVALTIGIKPKSDLRILEAIKYVLHSSTNNGNCYLVMSDIHREVNDLIGVVTTEKLIDILSKNENEVKYLDVDGERRYYNYYVFYAEKGVSLCLSEMLDIQQHIQKYEFIDDDTLSDEQRQAVLGALSNKISILTGGPGCGKTYTTKTIVRNLLNMGKRIAICAPTGKAAIRSTEVIGEKAVTIHRLLGWSEGSFTLNHMNPINTDYIIVEESSMIDILLMHSLLDAVHSRTQILFVGDFDQLPPVGPGTPFKDMVESELIPTYKLTKIFRQGENSRLIGYAHDINNGQYNHIDSPIEKPDMWKTDIDCMFIDSGFRPNDSKDKLSTLNFGLDLKEMLIKLYSETINKYRDYTDIQILVPKRVGSFGIEVINPIIQEIVNPPDIKKDEISVFKKLFRVGDKVIHTVNNYDLGDDGVFNGEIGFIKSIDLIYKTCVVEFVDKTVRYDKSDMNDLELAYAITIHKSQGSEFECVILPLITEYNFMMNRSLVYTALTRAKKLAIFLGSRRCLIKAIKSKKDLQRKTSLIYLLKHKVEDKLLSLTEDIELN